MYIFIDLHVHTSKSDGQVSPVDIIKLAKNQNLRAVAITDHDIIEGYYEAVDEANKLGVELVPGIELSCEADGKDIHVLGYYIDGTNKKFLDHLETMRYHRRMRIIEMAKNLEQFEIKISPDSIIEELGDGSPSRLHLARKMMERGFVRSISEAFKKYIGEKSPAYVKKMKLSVKECINLIHSIGGLAVLAHPGTYMKDHLIPGFIEFGLDGIEVYHFEHSGAQCRKYFETATKNGLLITGGSDFHGGFEDARSMGELKIPYSLLEDMKRALIKT